MSNPPKEAPGAVSSALFLLIGAAAGAAITIALTTPLREKLLSAVPSEFDPQDFLTKVTLSLQKSRDRVVETVDPNSGRSSS